MTNKRTSSVDPDETGLTKDTKLTNNQMPSPQSIREDIQAEATRQPGPDTLVSPQRGTKFS